jgi:hypothetical protein
MTDEEDKTPIASDATFSKTSNRFAGDAVLVVDRERRGSQNKELVS